MTPHDAQDLVGRLYKEHAARILAVLTRIFGVHNLQLAEDVLQEAFRKALVAWQASGVPDQPAAWLMQTAKNHAIDAVRANKTRTRFASDLAQHLESEWSLGGIVAQEFEETRIKEDQLRMVFVCCRDDVAAENRLPFILRTLCSFTMPAIARALVLPEATVRKRIDRTRDRLASADFALPTSEQLDAALETVHTVLYLMFNEGFHSSDAEHAIDFALCHEALGLASFLADAQVARRDTVGLLALMHFHFARAKARVDADGFNVPIDLQDRALWNRDWIAKGEVLLERAETVRVGGSGRFIVEARIARLHCIAPSFGDTQWGAIVAHYDELVRITDSPLAKLTRWVAAGYAGDVAAAIRALEELVEHQALRASHLPMAALAHMVAKSGDGVRARRLAAESKSRGGTPREHRLMDEQLERLLAERSTSP